MANLKLIPQSVYLNPNLLTETSLKTEDITINPLRYEAMVCYLDSQNYKCAYLSSKNQKITEAMNLELMLLLKNCNAATILVEASLVAGDSYLFITDSYYGENMMSVMQDFAEKKQMKVEFFNSSLQEQLKIVS